MESALMRAVKFNLLRRKIVDIRARNFADAVSFSAIMAAFAAMAVCMTFADPLVMSMCKRLPHWCAEAAQFFNHFGNGFNVFPVLAGAIIVFAFTIRMKLSRSTHEIITALAVRLIYLLAVIGIPCLMSSFLKWMFGRVRPKLFHHAGSTDFHFFSWVTDGSGLSFPSGHTTLAFSAALAFSTLLPKTRVPLFILAALVGAARVVLGAHYPSDAIGGALCGIVFATLVSRAFARQRLGLVVTENGKIQPKPWPRLGRFASLAEAAFGKLRGRPPAPAMMQTAGPA
jgi:membrane-associated phospholipid phosphatase